MPNVFDVANLVEQLIWTGVIWTAEFASHRQKRFPQVDKDLLRELAEVAADTQAVLGHAQRHVRVIGAI